MLPLTHLSNLRQIQSDRREALSLHHVLVEILLTAEHFVNRTRDKCLYQGTRFEMASLQDDRVRHRFGASFQSTASQVLSNTASVDELCEGIIQSLHAAAVEVLPVQPLAPNRPWIQTGTLVLISLRQQARSVSDWTTEKHLTRQIKKSALKDRSRWPDDVVAGGSWDPLKAFRKPMRVDSRKLQNAKGFLVESSELADTFATHLECVQWCERTLTDMPPSHTPTQDLPICNGPITAAEVSNAISLLKRKRTAVKVPAEYLHAVAPSDIEQGE